MEDHGGELLLADRQGGGARVSLVIPRSDSSAPAMAEEEAQQKQSRYGA
jgi:two-component system nitrogen regulation sensor histidine kinase NtrY